MREVTNFCKPQRSDLLFTSTWEVTSLLLQASGKCLPFFTSKRKVIVLQLENSRGVIALQVSEKWFFFNFVLQALERWLFYKDQRSDCLFYKHKKWKFFFLILSKQPEIVRAIDNWHVFVYDCDSSVYWVHIYLYVLFV